MSLPAFLVTIDTEGDDLWSRPRDITTRNVASLPRFQALCERHGLRPTWLVDYEMAMDPAFVRFGREVLRRDAGEIGMHLHAWNTPPLTPLTRDDFLHQPFLTDYPDDVAEEKVVVVTELLRDRFETRIASHRAGRWAFDARYARTLARLGYLVDCSVCPHVSWAATLGDPAGRGGPDFRRFPDRPYMLDLDHIDRPGTSDLLEVPVSVLRSRLHRLAPWSYRTPLLRRYAWRAARDRHWFYPDGRNLASLRAIVAEALRSGRPCVEMILHSSELMAGGSPNGADAAAVQRLYDDLEEVFAVASRQFRGMTLSEFRHAWVARSFAAGAPQGRPQLAPLRPTPSASRGDAS